MKSSRRFWVILAVIMLLVSIQLACGLPGYEEAEDQASTYDAEETQTKAAARTETKAVRQTERAEEDIYEETQEAIESAVTEEVIVTPEPMPTVGQVQATKAISFGEPILGLSGKWQYYGIDNSLSFDVTIDWNGQKYQAVSCTGYGQVECELKGSTWDGTTLEITFYFPVSGYTTKNFITKESVAGDVITAGRSGTGCEGTITLLRAPE